MFEWKRMVNSCVKQKERRKWIATSMIYKTLENGWGRWKIAKWDCEILLKVRVMFKLIITSNIKCGYMRNYEADAQVEHILFQCPNVENIHRIFF